MNENFYTNAVKFGESKGHKSVLIRRVSSRFDIPYGWPLFAAAGGHDPSSVLRAWDRLTYRRIRMRHDFVLVPGFES